MGVSQGSTTAVAAKATTCVDVAFLGARGSGEPFDDATRDMGKTVYGAYRRYAKRVTDRAVGGEGVTYPAQEVALLVVDKVKRQKMYFEGLDQGVEDVVTTVKAYADRCPSQRFVLAGYSQGAMVMHRAVWKLDKDRFDLSRIDGVLLIANGDRLPRGGILQYGSAENGRGVSWLRPKDSGDVYKPKKGVPDRLANRAHSVCIDYDIVCDANAFHTGLVTAWLGIKNHEKYAPGKPAAPKVDQAVAAIAAHTLRTPVVTTIPPTVDWSAKRDQVLSEINSARSQPRWCGQVQWPAAAPLRRIPSLDAAAQSYAVRQSTEGFTGHYSPEGLGPVERAAAEGYTGGLGEALGNGQETARQIVSGWMSSPGHCTVLMSAASVAGVGFADINHGPTWGFLGDCSCGGPSTRTKGVS